MKIFFESKSHEPVDVVRAAINNVPVWRLYNATGGDDDILVGPETEVRENFIDFFMTHYVENPFEGSWKDGAFVMEEIDRNELFASLLELLKAAVDRNTDESTSALQSLIDLAVEERS